MLDALFSSASGPLTAFLQVLMIDLVLAGDNAVAVGLAAGGLPVKDRKKVILYGLGAAVVLRIGFALITTWLLGVVGLLLAGGFLLLWVCWKMWRELREQAAQDAADASAVLDSDPNTEPRAKPAKSFKSAFLQVLIADVSMSLDNVLAVAGAAREHPGILVFGLLLSIALMGLAANAIAKLLHKHRWIGFIGLAIVLYVALHMVWEGHRSVVMDLHKTDEYNAAAPNLIDIKPDEVAKHDKHR
ncbi:tellurium resistance protein TerC [Caulobacter sp. D4A]|uniref:TerC family protein n=1 Tax=unclassified Caulobacter TaxID=2648921 RepID=UPI000D732806|nr:MULTISPECIES: TerC family protein [unclassified Caulobacter]PXA93447.1 tellurium resistance protein TerC [Caulobacter sp. D4A]PXA96352.1 tellurium resistance protein TerC [Caulobacter sp. D5]